MSSTKSNVSKHRDKRGLTVRQRHFCELIAQGIKGADASRQALYNTTAHKKNADKLLQMDKIKDYIDELREKSTNGRIADATEVLEFLTDMMRGDVVAPIVTKEGIKNLEPNHSIRKSSADTLAKHLGLLIDRVEQTGSNEITITFEGDLKSWSE